MHYRPTLPLLAAALALGAAAPAPAAPQAAYRATTGGTAPLFASHETLELTLVADFERLEDDRDEERPERLALLRTHADDGSPVEIPLTVRTRGNFRLRSSTCAFPNLRLDFPPDAPTAGTPFAGQDRLKLVSHCRDRDDYEQNLLEEHLAYRLFNLLTEVSFRVRLARITYQDVHGAERPVTRYAFFIEDEDALAARVGGIHIDATGAHPDQLDPLTSARVELFQYMIGNTDFSIVNFHNSEPFLLPDGTYHPVPYDFDFSGLVDAPYATPAALLGTRSVRERVFRGFCRLGLPLEPLYEQFLALRPAVAETVRQQPALTPRNARAAERYLDDFYRIIEPPGRRRAMIDARCRKTIDE